MTDTVIKLISEAVGSSAVSADEPMSKHTTFKIGGAADLMIEPDCTDGLIDALKLLKRFEIPYFVMGNGSNLLVGDRGIRGAVIKISSAMSGFNIANDEITAEAGIKLGRLANAAQSSSLAGLEFASGIPGTLGGALFMNAGAYGEEMKNIVTDVTYVDADLEKAVTIPAAECGFGYRRSIFSSMNSIITGCTLRLAKGSAEEIRNKMNDLAARRTEKQPLDKPSAGSTFKRPEGYFAGALIQDSGLKGCRIGGAEVSQKHSGFIVNVGGATAKDVAELIEHVRAEVKSRFGVELEPEVRFVGEF